MRIRIKLLLLIVFILNIADAEASTDVKIAKINTHKKKQVIKKIDLDQIWTFSYYEWNLIPQRERQEFIDNFFKESQKNTVLKKIKEISTEDKIKDALAIEEKWDLVESKINNFCKDEKNYSSCLKISKVRMNLLNKNSTHK